MRDVLNYNSDEYFLKEGYVYTGFLSTLAAGADGSAVVNVDTDADFFVMKHTFFITTGANDAPTQNNFELANLLVQIQDTSSGRTFFRRPLPLPSVFGTGSDPFIWPAPYGVQGGGTLEFTFTNNTAATVYNNIYCNLIGMKAYRRSR